MINKRASVKGKEILMYDTKREIYLPHPEGALQRKTEMPGGLYTILNSSDSLFGFQVGFSVVKYPKDLINFSEGIVSDVVKDCDDFFSEGVVEKYKQLTIPHQMGILMYGPPGTGKTCTALLVSKLLAEKYGAITIDADDWAIHILEKAIRTVREFSNQPVIVFFDEFEEHTGSVERPLLHFLDGSTGLDGVISIACTNYLHKIPDRITNRKSRIKYLHEVDTLPRAVYVQYLKEKFPEQSKEFFSKFSVLAEEEGLRIDEVKHAIIDHYIGGSTIEEAISNVKGDRPTIGKEEIDTDHF